MAAAFESGRITSPVEATYGLDQLAEALAHAWRGGRDCKIHAHTKRANLMILADSLSRLQTETAFEVLARAAELQRQGKDIINLGIGQPDFKRLIMWSKPRSRPCATVITAIPPRTAFLSCAKRLSPTFRRAGGRRSARTMS